MCSPIYMTGCICALRTMGKTLFHFGKVHIKGWMKCHGMPRPHAPNHLRSSPTPPHTSPTRPHAPNHLRLHPTTLRCHSDVHCVSSHNHATPVAGLNSDQCLISPNLVLILGPPSICLFLHMPHLPDAFSLMITGNHASLI